MAGCWHMSKLRDALCLGGQLTYTKCSGFLPVSATSCCSSLLCQIPEMVTVTPTEGERRKDGGGGHNTPNNPPNPTPQPSNRLAVKPRLSSSIFRERVLVET